MKKWVLFFSAPFLLLLAGCGNKDAPLETLKALERGTKSPRSIEEIQDSIKRYDDAAKAVSDAQGRVGNWYKILGSRYLDKKMYGEALKNYQAAVEYYPDNQNLHYWVGICAGMMGASSYDQERSDYVRLAERAYLRSLEIDNRYTRPLYALGVLYVFELDDCPRAIPHLEKLLTIDKKNNDARFVLARAYYVTGNYRRAIELYDLIIQDTKNADRRSEALSNKALAEEALRGAP